MEATNEHWLGRHAMKKLGLFLIVTLTPLVMGAAGCPNLTNLTQASDDPESYCSRAGAFWCNTNIVPQTLTAQGWNGYCMVGVSSGYDRGYSGVTGTGGATPVYPTTDQAWHDGCAASGVTGRGVCNSVVTCTKH
jgi:hypothetical protein